MPHPLQRTASSRREAASLVCLRLTERDCDILEALGGHRFLTIPQMTALYFDAQATAEKRMRALYKAGLIVRVFAPVRPRDRAVTTIYGLSAKGAKQVREHREGAQPQFLTSRAFRSALFLDHTLRRNDLHICLELLDQDQGGFHLLVWRQKPEEVRGAALVRVHGARSWRIPIVPDGFFAVRWHGEVHSFAVEIDMGTVSPEKMRLRYRAYWTWWKQGGMAERFGDAPVRVLTLTTHESRLDALRRCALQAPAHGRRGRGSGLFWFTLLGNADITEPRKLLGACWSVARAGPSAPFSLFDTS